jgi:hypothetical protein
MINNENAYKYLTTRRSYKLDPNFKVISVHSKTYNDMNYYIIKTQKGEIIENVYSFKTEVDKWIIDQRKEKLKILDEL